MPEKIVRRKPEDTKADPEISNPVHRIELRADDGEELAYVELKYFGRPFPFYYLSYVHTSAREQGYGSRMIELVQDFLKKKKVPGILQDHAPTTVGNIYERHGWSYIFGFFKEVCSSGHA